MEWVGAGRGLIEIEIQAGLKQYSATEMNSVIFSDKGLASKRRLLAKAETNLELLEKFATDHVATERSLELCRSLYRQTTEVQGGAEKQVKRIERTLELMRGAEQLAEL